MCLCVLSKQANASYAMDFDIPSFVDVHVEVCNDHDSQELTAIKPNQFMPFVMASVDPVMAELFYRQPEMPPLLRPPAV